MTTAVLRPARSRTRFQARAFVSLFLVTSLVFFVLSGLVLYVAPSGRVAESGGWRLLWLDKGQWEAMHTSVSLIWTPVAALHVLYNWRPVLAYLRNKGKRAVKLGRELAVASAITLLLVVTSLGDWAPVKQLMAFGASMDTYWTDRANANGYYIPLGSEELPAGSSETATAPAVATAAIGGATEVRKGFGRFTVMEIAERYDITLETATARLADKGVRDIKPDETLLALSGRSGYSPSDLDAIVQDKPLVSTEEGK